MKVHKLTKRDYWDFDSLMRKMGVVDEENKTANPSATYVNEKTYNAMSREVRKRFRKEYPLFNAKRTSSWAGMHMLNMSPATCDAIKDGYCVSFEKNEVARRLLEG